MMSVAQLRDQVVRLLMVARHSHLDWGSIIYSSGSLIFLIPITQAAVITTSYMIGTSLPPASVTHSDSRRNLCEILQKLHFHSALVWPLVLDRRWQAPNPTKFIV